MSFFLAPPSKNPILASSTAAPARTGARSGDGRIFKNAMPMDFSRLNCEVMSDTKMCYESIPLLKDAVRESIRRPYMVEEGLDGVMWLIRSSAA